MKRYEAIAVYILASARNGTLYIGVTSHLPKRIHEHKTQAMEGFSKRYNTKLLVYYELYTTMESAITREKRLKKYKRSQKLVLIKKFNPEWRDMYEEICQ